MQKMKNMTAYNNGYVPPKGSAGAAAFGQFSTKHNPMGVPRKGSAIEGTSEFGSNKDHMKVRSLQSEEAKRESLRGYAC